MPIRKYRNLDTFVRAMQRDKKKKLWADWFYIAGHWYVMEEYDESGKYMRITSITKGEHIDLETSNRYSDKWLTDLKATAYPAEGYLFHWEYYIKREDLAKLILKLKQSKLDDLLKNINKAN